MIYNILILLLMDDIVMIGSLGAWIGGSIARAVTCEVASGVAKRCLPPHWGEIGGLTARLAILGPGSAVMYMMQKSCDCFKNLSHRGHNHWPPSGNVA